MSFHDHKWSGLTSLPPLLSFLSLLFSEHARHTLTISLYPSCCLCLDLAWGIPDTYLANSFTSCVFAWIFSMWPTLIILILWSHMPYPIATPLYNFFHLAPIQHDSPKCFLSASPALPHEGKSFCLSHSQVYPKLSETMPAHSKSPINICWMNKLILSTYYGTATLLKYFKYII